MKRWLLIATVLGIATAGAAGATLKNQWAPYPALRSFKVKVWGKCSAGRGRINIQISGMTPMGTFHWREWQPDGKEISFQKYFTNGYTLAVTPRNGTIRLDEDCSTDHSGGRYKLSAWDETTPGRSPAVVRFNVGPTEASVIRSNPPR